MFERLFGKKKSKLAEVPDSLGSNELLQMTESSVHSPEAAAELLVAPSALMQFTHQEALTAVRYMVPRCISEGTTFITEGEKHDNGYMMLLLEGEVTIENSVVSRRTPITVSVLGPGSLVGEVSMVDGRPRLASCTASTDVRCLVLSRRSLERLCAAHPTIGAKLMMAVSVRIAERLRGTTEKLKTYGQLVHAMQQESTESIEASVPENPDISLTSAQAASL